MTPMLFDVGGSELLVIIVLAVLLLGPERVPELAKKAGRIIGFLRGVANEATDTIKQQLGPEYADLTPGDLQPKRLLQKTVLKDLQADLDDIKAQVDGLKQDLEGQLSPIKGELDEVDVNLAAEVADLEAKLKGLKSQLTSKVEETMTPE